MSQLKWAVVALTAVILIAYPPLSQAQTPKNLSPILLVPGLTCSQLRVKDESPHHPFCHTLRDFWGLWINPFRFVEVLCAQRELELDFKAEGNVYTNKEGVSIEVPGFGETWSVQWLNTSENILFKEPYMNDLVRYFEARGYKDGVNIRAAPYDWRLAADNLERLGYYDKLKKLVEEMYQQNGNRKVTIVVHSMGGPVSLHFLTGFAPVTQQWKDTHINAWVTLSGAWSGGNSALQELISGISSLPGIFIHARHFVDKLLLPIIRSLEAGVWMMPRAMIWKDTTLVSTPSHSYTANDYQKMFADIGFTNGFAMYQGMQKINPGYPAPNVKTYCFYGVDVKTTQSFTYDKDFTPGVIPDTPKIAFGDGDGTVNTLSSEICLKWKNMPSQYPFNRKTFSKVSHHGMVTDDHVLATIGSIVGASADPLELSRERSDGSSTTTSTYVISFVAVAIAIMGIIALCSAGTKKEKEK